MAIRLSETSIGKMWLRQFHPADQVHAELLLDSLQLINRDKFIQELRTLIEQESQESQQTQQRFAIIPVREVNTHGFWSSSDRDAEATAIPLDPFPGSESVVAHVCTQFKRSLSRKTILVDSIGLKSMREKHCHTVFFIDDSINSGNRIISFLNEFESHKTIKSWLSYKLIHFHVLTYTATDIGITAVKSRSSNPTLTYVKKYPTFDDMLWTRDQRKAIEDICMRYAPRGKQMALGYQETKGMLIFQHSVPNNIPGILWQDSRRWMPLFQGRVVPDQIIAAFNYSSVEEEIEIRLQQLGQHQLSKGAWLPLADPYVAKIILVLSAVARRSNNKYDISNTTGLSTLEVEKILLNCQKWGLVDQNNRMTGAGLSELAHARKVKARTQKGLALSEDFYYPQSLRKA